MKQSLVTMIRTVVAGQRGQVRAQVGTLATPRSLSTEELRRVCGGGSSGDGQGETALPRGTW